MKIVCMLFFVLLSACASDVPISGNKPAVSRLLYSYESSVQCSGCHTDQHRQYEDSMHANAFSNPLFNAQYFKDVVPRAQLDPAFVPEARQCLACHAPVVFMNYTGLVTTPDQASRFETGVTCDFCHTLEGYAENGDYLQVPSGKKQGPYQIEGAATHHSEFSGFMQLSEYCGHCHNATNHVGLGVKSTYDEWRESSYGMSGNTSIVTCQECHMSKDGFLRKGVAEFARGPAAYINILSDKRKQNEHEKLYNHSFPGAHSLSQQQDALLLDFTVGARTADKEGILPIAVLVNNERTGHKMPSGSTDLRFMWLVVTATTADGTTMPIMRHASVYESGPDYSIAGASPDDAGILGNDVPAGSRLYRTVMVNSAGRQSLYQTDAVRIAFDNRLGAAEIRNEGYFIKLPVGFSGKIALEASLYYKGAPSSFTKRMEVPAYIPVLVASRKKQVSIEAAHASEK